MSNFDKNSIMRFLEYVQRNDSPLTPEEMEKYNEILNVILNDPYLLTFLDKKFGELISNYIIDNQGILMNSNVQLKRDENGFFQLDGVDFIEREHNGGGKFAKKWILVGNGKSGRKVPMLIKELDKDNNIYTTLISEQIAREAGYEVAIYYPAVLNGNNVVLTPSFLNIENDSNGNNVEEQMIQGRYISGINMDISENPNLIRKYFIDRGILPEEREKIVERYNSTMLFNIFVNSRDGHNGNWGVIKSLNNQYRFAPIFDLEGGLAENSLNIRATNLNGIYDNDEAMIKYLLRDPKMRKYAEALLNINMDRVYENIELSKRVKVPQEVRKATNKVIENSKSLLYKVMNRREQQTLDDYVRE